MKYAKTNAKKILNSNILFKYAPCTHLKVNKCMFANLNVPVFLKDVSQKLSIKVS